MPTQVNFGFQKSLVFKKKEKKALPVFMSVWIPGGGGGLDFCA